MFSLEEMKMYTSQLGKPQHYELDLVNRVVLCSKFTTYSDFYFKNNQTLNTYLVPVRNLVQTERNILVSNTESNFNTAFVPFYYKYAAQDTPGLLLNLPKFDLNESRDKLELESCLFKNNVPIFVSTSDYFYPRKVCSHHYSRISFLNGKKKTVQNVNLDEIMPVLDEMPCSSDVLHYDEADSFEEHTNQPINERDVLLLNPLLLESVTRTKPRLTQSEHRKIARITIMYTLAFFALVLITFFVIYLA